MAAVMAAYLFSSHGSSHGSIDGWQSTMPDLWAHNPSSVKQICQLRTQQMNGCLGTAAAAAPLNVLQEDLQQTFIALHWQRSQQTCIALQWQYFQQVFISSHWQRFQQTITALHWQRVQNALAHWGNVFIL